MQNAEIRVTGHKSGAAAPPERLPLALLYIKVIWLSLHPDWPLSGASIQSISDPTDRNEIQPVPTGRCTHTVTQPEHTHPCIRLWVCGCGRTSVFNEGPGV